MSKIIYEDLFKLFETIQFGDTAGFNQFLERNDFKELANFDIEPLTTPLTQEPNKAELLRIAHTGSNILLWAVEMGRLDMVQHIIDKCPKLLTQKSLTGDNVLHQLSKIRTTDEVSDLDVFKLLKIIAEKAPDLLNEKNKDNFTPVELFAMTERKHLLDFFKGNEAKLLPFKAFIPDWKNLHDLANQGGLKSLQTYVIANHIQELYSGSKKLTVPQVLELSKESDFYTNLVAEYPLFEQQAKRFEWALDDRDDILKTIKRYPEIVKYELFEKDMNKGFEEHLGNDNLKLKYVTKALADLVQDAVKLDKSFDTFKQELESTYHAVKQRGLDEKYFPGKYLLKFLKFLFRLAEPNQKNLVDVFFEAMAKQRILGLKTRYTKSLYIFGEKLGQEPIKKEEDIDKKVHLIPRA